eukprot:TRINITY_DN28309_c0_g1_i2.p1 TRINITY_DN28309_c0_g1~~TRINITY_DN28309_c0_g1_i2.p1  ORF type:complete len:463 (+),score=83.61 TRINITY_DN28309_c0_g1_i2:69-1391(+)
MRIVVETTTGGRIPLSIDAGDSIQDIVRRIEAGSGVEVDEVKLVISASPAPIITPIVDDELQPPVVTCTAPPTATVAGDPMTAMPSLYFAPVVSDHVVFAFDVSSSMEGRRIRKAVSELNAAITRLPESCLFDVLRFSDSVEHFKGTLVAADNPTKAAARQWTRTSSPFGGTDIVLALETALAHEGVEEIHLLTDAGDGDGLRELEKFDGVINLAVKNHVRINATHIDSLGELVEKWRKAGQEITDKVMETPAYKALAEADAVAMALLKRITDRTGGELLCTSELPAVPSGQQLPALAEGGPPSAGDSFNSPRGGGYPPGSPCGGSSFASSRGGDGSSTCSPRPEPRSGEADSGRQPLLTPPCSTYRAEQSTKRCPLGHPIDKRKEGLKWHQNFSGTSTFGLATKMCGHCRRPIARNEVRWRCSQHCNYNLCEACFDAAR